MSVPIGINGNGWRVAWAVGACVVAEVRARARRSRLNARPTWNHCYRTPLYHMLRLLGARFDSRMICGAVRGLSIPRKNQLPPRPKWLIVEDEIDEKFIKGGRGPGGQKINKTNSKVQLTHIPTGLVVTCQYSRSQESNRKKAREILALKLEDLANPLESRTAVVNTRKTLTKQSKTKKLNRKYKEIDERRLLDRQQQKLHELLLMEQFSDNEVR